MANLPKNVAIIMDGNGRWAQKRLHPRVWGHVRGSFVVSDIVEEAQDLGLNSLTLFAFSTENWSRPVSEIKVLIKLLDKFLARETGRILENKIQFKVIGNLESLPAVLRSRIAGLETQTAAHTGLKLIFAFNYGGRSEIVNAANLAIASGKQVLTENDISQFLYQPAVPEIDLLIRTSGEQRISNFLLWQLAYSELAFTNSLWPDFSKMEFRSIIENVSTRQRRFGSYEKASSYTDIANRAQEHQLQFKEELDQSNDKHQS
ncbi:MAG: di-trans,poly-cis-decaprenylcistransferase [Bacteriovoracaceae bacterium]|nr:di-trans,poly-cis-decaprenylcistransferase [Bacteriovoracaceae bacterium]